MQYRRRVRLLGILMFKTFSIGLALLAGLLGSTQAGYVPTPSQALALSDREEPRLDAIGPPPLADCALGCNHQPLSLIVPPPDEARVPEPAGLALAAVAALAGLLVCRIHRRTAATSPPDADTVALDDETVAPDSLLSVAPSSAFHSTAESTGAPQDQPGA